VPEYSEDYCTTLGQCWFSESWY